MPNDDDYFRSKVFKEMLEEFERNEKEGIPNVISSDDYADIAEFYYDKGDKKRAEHVADTAAEMYQGATAPLLFKARMELIDRRNADRAEQIAELIEDKSDTDYYYFQAELMLTRGHAAEADAYLEERYTDIDDDDKEFYLIEVSSLFIDYNETEIAERWAARCTEHDLDGYKALCAQIAIAHEDFETSKRIYKELLDKDPYSTVYWNALAGAQLLSDDSEGSISSSEYSLAIDPDNADGIINMANGLYNIENYKEALKYYTRYAEMFPNDENAEMLLGLCWLMLDEYKTAIGHLRKALEANPSESSNAVDIHRAIVWAAGYLGAVDEAFAELDLFVAAGGNRCEALVLRCALLQKRGDNEKAEALLLNAIEKSELDTKIFIETAISLYESGRPRAAYNLFSLIFKHMRELHTGRAYFAACCHSIAVCCHNAELWNRFVDNVRQAAEHEPKEAQVVLGHLFPEGMKPSEYYDYLIDKSFRLRRIQQK